MRIKEFRLAILEFDEEKNILFYRVKQDIIIDVLEINEMIDYVTEFIGETKHYGLVDFGTSVGSTTEGRKSYAKSAYINKYRKADAFLVKSLAVRLIANFFIKVTRPEINTKLFTSEEQAIEWLMELEAKDKV